MINCIFCKIINREIPCDKIYEDENFLAFLDITPVNPGHALLIPKKHYENLYEIPSQTLNEILPIIKKIAIAVKNGVNADGINIGMNNGKAAGQLVPHAHFHIIPRFQDDGRAHWRGAPYSENESQKTAEKIRKFL